MGLYTIIALALALSADAFSFAIGLGMAGVTRQQEAALSLSVLVFHIAMPLIGYYVGGFFGTYFGKYAGWLGALILVILGLKMAWEGFGDEEEKMSGKVLSTFYGIMAISFAVSIDALSVGITLGTQKVPLGMAAGLIGIIAGSITFLGFKAGKKIGEWVGHRAMVVGGLVLVYIGGRLFV